MPELPEVETVRNTLKNYIIGRRIDDLITPYPDIIKAKLSQFRNCILGQRFNDILRFGKYLIFVLDDYSLISHLRMEGKYFIRSSMDEITKHEHIIFKLDNDVFLSYHDVRKFGTMELVNIGQEFQVKSLKSIGKEVNDPNLDSQEIYKMIVKSNRAIKTVLLDQKIVSGLGNIYVDETLFRARINPEEVANKLNFQEVKNILKSAKSVIDKAILLGGTTIRTYQSSLGVDGRFQNELAVHTKENEPCLVCNDTIKKTKVGGRGTYFCPTCQKRKII